MKKVFKLGGKIALVILSIILLAIFILTIIILCKSSGKPIQFLDKNGKVLEGSISEKIYVEINGVEQGMFIKGKDKTKPVLLFLHGGPAMPQNWFSQNYPNGIEDEFIVCWWEQRGAGISYNKDIIDTVTSDQLVSDTIEVSKYLKERFKKEKIYLMGHSWGSSLGIQAAAKAPELYYSYVGIGQISDLTIMTQETYAYCLDYYKQNSNQKMVNKILKNPFDPADPYGCGWMKISDCVTGTAGVATTREMKSEITGIFFPSFFATEYTVKEKINLWKSFFSDSSRALKKQLFNRDLSTEFCNFEIPIYFFTGRYDYVCAYPLTKKYLDELDAPIKGFYTFEDSAHSPIFEEPERFMQILKEDVLTGQTALKDK